MSLGDVYQLFFYAVWLALIIFWGVSARNVKVTARRQAALPRVLNLALLYGAAALLAGPFVPIAWLTRRVLPPSQWEIWCALGAALTLLGLSLTVSARIYLGRNWSSVAAVKVDHELVTGGPYRWVRHPIYAGLLLAFVGTALANGQWRGVLAVVLSFVAVAQRIVIEERLMRQRFGPAYDAYAQRVRGLIPGIV
jgi:protein-S-isoprenylcysteine O-methyltransferase Ste14